MQSNISRSSGFVQAWQIDWCLLPENILATFLYNFILWELFHPWGECEWAWVELSTLCSFMSLLCRTKMFTFVLKLNIHVSPSLKLHLVAFGRQPGRAGGLWHLPPIHSEDVRVVHSSYESSYHITTWSSMTTQTHTYCLPEEACVIQYLQQTALQLLQIVPSALFSVCGGGDINAGGAGRLNK